MATAAALKLDVGDKIRDAGEETFEAVVATAFEDDDEEEESKQREADRLQRQQLREANLKAKAEQAEEEYAIEDENENVTVQTVIKNMASNFVKLFIDYGPPYTEEPETLHGSLVDECAELNMSLLNVHMLLNDRADPNIPDPEDLYYTPLHWCARNFHLLAAKMLLRAKANIDRPNEFGITPFGLCVITTPTENYESKKLKMMKWFLKKNVNVNWRDKGGFTALDYAVMNDDVMAVKLILNHGALINRDNKILVAKRIPVLDNWKGNPEIYKLVLEANEIETKKREHEAVVRLNATADIREIRRVQKLYHDLAKLKEAKILKKKQRETHAEKEKRELEYKRKLLDALDYLKLSVDIRRGAGGWIRNEAGQWHWSDVVKKKKDLDKLYNTSVNLMHTLRKKNKIDEYNNKWKILTDGGNIEMKWDKADKFRIEGEIYSDDENLIKDDDSVHSFRDENDAELDGENLDDLMGLL